MTGPLPLEQVSLPGDDTLWLPAETASVGTARRHVVRTLTDWGVDRTCIEDAELLVSELVSNVVAHTASRRVGVAVDGTDRRVTVSVREWGATETPEPETHPLTDFAPRELPGPTAASGRGLRILDALATDWGISRHHRTTSTWFSLATARPLPLEVVSPAAAAELRSVQAGLRRTRLLLRITEDLSCAVSAAQVGEAVARHLAEEVGATFVGIALVDVESLTSDAPMMRYLDLSVFADDVREQWGRFRLDSDAPVAAVARSGVAEYHESVETAERDHPGLARHMRAARSGALAHVPLVADGICLGTLALAWSEAREFDADLRALLTIVAGYAAQALRRRDAGAEALALARLRYVRATADFEAALDAGDDLATLQSLDDEVRRAAAAVGTVRPSR